MTKQQRYSIITRCIVVGTIIGGIFLAWCVEELKTHLNAHTKQIDALVAKVQENEERIDKLESDVSELLIMIIDTLEYEYKMDQLEEVEDLLQRVIDEGYNIR